MNTNEFGLRVAALVVIAASSGALAAEPDAAIHFKYAPPEGTEFVETVITTRVRSIEGSGSRVDRSESRSLHTISKHNDEYLLSSKLVFAELTRNGEAQTDLVSKLMNNVTLVYRIGPDGQLRQISGYGDLFKQAEASMPAEAARALAPLLSEAAMQARETAEWNGRIGFFVGLSPHIGQVISGDTPYTLPNGETIHYTVRTSFPRMEPCRGGSCVRIEIRYDSDTAALDKLVPGDAKDAAAAGAAQSVIPSFTGGSISGGASRLVDPQTMLIYEEHSQRTITMNVTLPGGATVPAMQRETRQHSFTYR